MNYHSTRHNNMMCRRNIIWYVSLLLILLLSFTEVVHSNNNNNNNCMINTYKPYMITYELSFNHIINDNEKTITIELIYNGIGWLSIGFGTSSMISSIVIIGLPISNNNTLSSYVLHCRDIESIEQLSYNHNTTIANGNNYIIQNDTHTILRYTRPLLSSDISSSISNNNYGRMIHNDTIIVNEENDFIWAFGNTNEFGFHANRGIDSIVLNQYCNRNTKTISTITATTTTTKTTTIGGYDHNIIPVNIPATIATTTSSRIEVNTTTTSTTATEQSLQGTFVSNQNDILIHATTNTIHQTITIDMMYNGFGWIGIAFTYENKQYNMIGSQGIIGSSILSPNGGVLKYDLTSKSMDGILLSPETRQSTLTNRIFQQNTTHTYMKFTKKLIENDEPTIYTSKSNTILYAVGYENELGIHKRRGTFTLSLNDCITTDLVNTTNNDGMCSTSMVSINTLYDSTQMKWKTHGILMSIAFVLLIPLGIGSRWFQKILYIKFKLSGDIWFQLHRGFNLLGVLFTIIGFFVGLSALNDEGSQLFNGGKHHTIGFSIFILIVIQAIGGYIRPKLSNNTIIPNSLELQEHHNTNNDMNHSINDFSEFAGNRTVVRQQQQQPSSKSLFHIDINDNNDAISKYNDSGSQFDNDDINTVVDDNNTQSSRNTNDDKYHDMKVQNNNNNNNINNITIDDILNNHNNNNFTISRPSYTDNNPSDQYDHEHETSTNEGKSKYRYIWEIIHRLLGFILLFLAWYNCNSGIQLYDGRYNNSNGNSNILWGFIGTIIGISIFLSCYQKWIIKNSSSIRLNRAITKK